VQLAREDHTIRTALLDGASWRATSSSSKASNARRLMSWKRAA